MAWGVEQAKAQLREPLDGLRWPRASLMTCSSGTQSCWSRLASFRIRDLFRGPPSGHHDGRARPVTGWLARSKARSTALQSLLHSDVILPGFFPIRRSLKRFGESS